MVQAGSRQTLKDEWLDLLDWNNIYLELQAYKDEQKYFNLLIQQETPKELFKSQEELFKLLSPGRAGRSEKLY